MHLSHQHKADVAESRKWQKTAYVTQTELYTNFLAWRNHGRECLIKSQSFYLNMNNHLKIKVPVFKETILYIKYDEWVGVTKLQFFNLYVKALICHKINIVITYLFTVITVL